LLASLLAKFPGEPKSTLDEYSRLVGERAGVGHAEDAQRVLTAMLAELERKVEPTAES
jgi:hypothetical protein